MGFVTIPIVLIVQNLFNPQMDTQTESQKKNATVSTDRFLFYVFVISVGCFVSTTTNAQQIVEQPDPCKSKSRVVGDVEYCDRYWECEDHEPVLYDCPNGLVWVGKDRGIADGCDYPWRNPTLCNNKDLASK